MKKFQKTFDPADLQRHQAPKREEPTYGSCRWSHNDCPKRDADVDNKTLWELEQVLSIGERRPRGTEVSTGRETREQPQARVERERISHDIYRFSTVAVDILGLVTMAMSTKANYVLVFTDLFTMYTVAVHLVSMDSADVAREIVENFVLKFGSPNGLHTDQGESFSGKLIQEMCRLLGID